MTGTRALAPRREPGSNDFWIDGIRFRVSGGSSDQTSDDGVVLLKPWSFVEAELDAVASIDVQRMLEVGVFQGGSAVIWMLARDLERYIGIDHRSLDIAFPSAVTRHPAWETVRLFGGVSQDDGTAIRPLLSRELTGPLDLVVDDGSHQYLLTRRTFEICFPRLRPGGAYLIEDWAWAHHPPFTSPEHPWHGNPSLANLVFRLVVLVAMRPDVIERLIVRRPFVIAIRGNAELDDDFDIDETAGSPRRLSELI
jgi:hypothetical protein